MGGATASAGLAATRRKRLSVVETSALLIVDALARVVTIPVARDMGVIPGTMGLAVVAFLGLWTLMMAAMMLPSITPLASLYARTMRDHRARRVGLLAAGYLAVWAAVGLAAFGLAVSGERLADHAPGWAQATAVASCLACGIYQMTPLKDRCSQKCRSLLGICFATPRCADRWLTPGSVFTTVHGVSPAAGRSCCCSSRLET